MDTKNPRRQAAQYRVMARNHRRLLPALVLLWVALVALLVLALALDWHTLIKLFCGIGVVSGFIQNAKVVSELREYARRARELEGVDAVDPQ